MAQRPLNVMLRFVAAGAAIAAVAYAFLPKPVPVETVRVTRGPMRQTIDEQGLTSIRTRYVIAAPLAGQLERITWRAGDSVTVRETTLARIHPADPMLLDARSTATAEARLRTAEINLKRMSALQESAKAMLQYAQSELERAEKLSREDAKLIDHAELERARLMQRTRADELKAAGYSEEIAKIERDAAEAALAAPTADDANSAAVFAVAAPVSGTVLRVLRTDAGVVAAGMPLLEIGDVTNLEVLVNVLSMDAVRIRPRAKAIIEGWGGDAAIDAVVRQVEPSAVTSVSTLGVAEQRVKVSLDLDTAASQLMLGDNFSVQVRIVEWEEADVLQVPVGGLVRRGEQWCVFRVEEGRAVQRVIQIGRRNGQLAQVLSGLEADDEIVAYPSDRIIDNVPVTPQSSK